MSIEYLGLSSINGPLIALEGVQDAFFDEIVEFVVDGTQRKIGRIVEIYEDKAVIQVFEGSENMSLKNTHTKLPSISGESAISIGWPVSFVCVFFRDIFSERLTGSEIRSTDLDRLLLR